MVFLPADGGEFFFVLRWDADETGLLRKALVVADFFITFCLRVPQATVRVVLMTD